MLTNWTTMRGQSSVATITQSEAQWLDLRGFEDFVAWLEVREVTLPTGATHVTLTYQTSPTKDELLFTPCATALNLDAIVGLAPYIAITPVIKANASVPLSRWLRYQLAVTGSPSAAWDTTFRIWVAANSGVTARSRAARRSGSPVRQSGKICPCDAVTGGSRPMTTLMGRPAVLGTQGAVPTGAGPLTFSPG